MAKRTFWTPEEDALLATDIAPVVAAKIGRTVGAVRRRRHTLGISPVRSAFPCEACGVQVCDERPLGAPKRFCPACSRERRRASQRTRDAKYYALHPERYSGKTRRWRLLKAYGLTPADYDRMLAEQDGRCLLCKAEESDSYGRRFYIDHDHLNGVVRGLLCGACNMGIGQLKDDPALMRAAAAYVERYRLRDAG